MTTRLDTGFRPNRAALLALALAACVATHGAVAGVRAGGKGFGTGTGANGPRDGAAQEDEALILHVLSRTTYGPTADLLDEVRRVGVDEFLRQQLHPEELADADVEAQLATELPPVDDVFYQWNEFYYEHLLRARYSNRQLQEVMVQFWENHFDTVVIRGNNDIERHAWTMMEQSENAGFREHALGYFRDLIEVSAKSQAMLYFLDNFRSTAFTLNENYARELLELHSLGVDCGYDQQDVIEVARIFTGWTGLDLQGAPPGPRDIVEGTFLFRVGVHDATPKHALGYDFPAGGLLDDGLRVLDIVSRHPCTARFISYKLLQAFVMDFPPDELVDRIASVYLETEGHVGSVLAAIFATPEFRSPASFDSKVKTPLEFTISALRATDARVGARPSDGALNRELYAWIRLEGMELFNYPIPTGYYEYASEWIGANGFLQRWRFADALSYWAPRDNRFTWIEPMATVAARGLTDADAVIDHYATLLTRGRLTDDRRQTLVATLTGGTGVFDPTDPGQDSRLRQVISHLLGSPEFTKQ